MQNLLAWLMWIDIGALMIVGWFLLTNDPD